MCFCCCVTSLMCSLLRYRVLAQECQNMDLWYGDLLGMRLCHYILSFNVFIMALQGSCIRMPKSCFSVQTMSLVCVFFAVLCCLMYSLLWYSLRAHIMQTLLHMLKNDRPATETLQHITHPSLQPSVTLTYVYQLRKGPLPELHSQNFNTIFLPMNNVILSRLPVI